MEAREIVNDWELALVELNDSIIDPEVSEELDRLLAEFPNLHLCLLEQEDWEEIVEWCRSNIVDPTLGWLRSLLHASLTKSPEGAIEDLRAYIQAVEESRPRVKSAADYLVDWQKQIIGYCFINVSSQSLLEQVKESKEVAELFSEVIAELNKLDYWQDVVMQVASSPPAEGWGIWLYSKAKELGARAAVGALLVEALVMILDSKEKMNAILD